MRRVPNSLVEDAMHGSATAYTTVTLADGTEFFIDGGYIVQGSLTVTHSSSSSNSFDIGGAYAGSASIGIRNDDRWLDAYDLSYCYFEPSIANAAGDWLTFGRYYVGEIQQHGDVVTLAGYDEVGRLATPFNVQNGNTPVFRESITLQEIAEGACRVAGAQHSFRLPGVATLRSLSLGEYRLGYVSLEDWPKEVIDATCLEVLGWAAQLAGCFAVADDRGRIVVRTYDFAAFNIEFGEAFLDGGTFTAYGTSQYRDGDRAEGGGFMWGAGHYDGWSFKDARYIVVQDPKSVTVNVRDIEAGSLSITVPQTPSAEGWRPARLPDPFWESGAPWVIKGSHYDDYDYHFDIVDNPLLIDARAMDVIREHEVRLRGVNLHGIRIRPMRVIAPLDIRCEAGDAVMVVDRHGISYRTWVTQVTLSTSGTMTLVCSAGGTSDSQMRPSVGGSTGTSRVLPRTQREKAIDSKLSRLNAAMQCASDAAVSTYQDVDDLEVRVSELESGGGSGGGTGAGWTFQIDGITLESGTVNFITSDD